MSSLGDAIAQALGRVRYEYRTPPLADAIAEVQAKYGSGRKAAAATGVSEATWRRWKSGATRPKQTNVDKLQEAVRRVRVAILPGGMTDGGLTIKTTDRHDGRERTLRADNLRIKPGTADRVMRAYVTSGQEAAAAQLVGGIGDNWYRSWIAAGLAADWRRDPEDWYDEMIYEWADDIDSGYGTAVGGVS